MIALQWFFKKIVFFSSTCSLVSVTRNFSYADIIFSISILMLYSHFNLFVSIHFPYNFLNEFASSVWTWGVSMILQLKFWLNSFFFFFFNGSARVCARSIAQKCLKHVLDWAKFDNHTTDQGRTASIGLDLWLLIFQHRYKKIILQSDSCILSIILSIVLFLWSILSCKQFIIWTQIYYALYK